MACVVGAAHRNPESFREARGARALHKGAACSPPPSQSAWPSRSSPSCSTTGAPSHVTIAASRRGAPRSAWSRVAGRYPPRRRSPSRAQSPLQRGCLRLVAVARERGDSARVLTVRRRGPEPPTGIEPASRARRPCAPGASDARHRTLLDDLGQADPPAHRPHVARVNERAARDRGADRTIGEARERGAAARGVVRGEDVPARPTVAAGPAERRAPPRDREEGDVGVAVRAAHVLSTPRPGSF